MSSPIIRISTVANTLAVTAGGEIRGLSRLVQLRLPGSRGHFSWSRPVAVRLQAPDGTPRDTPIRDVTAWCIGAMAVATAVAIAVAIAAWRAAAGTPREGRRRAPEASHE